MSRKDGLPLFYKINRQSGEVPDWNGIGYRLPTEAEWEYACRSGSSSRYCFGDDERSLGRYAWYSTNSGGKTHPVGEKNANAFGLHDMHGNVWEWCLDGYDAKYYHNSPERDPFGSEKATARVIRGGSWYRVSRYARLAARDGEIPVYRYAYLGFRVARVLS